MGIQNDVGGSVVRHGGTTTAVFAALFIGAALAFEGLNDIVVLAFRKQGSLSHT